MSDSDSDDDLLSFFGECARGNKKRVEKLLKDGTDIEEVNDRDSQCRHGVMTPLQGAVMYCQLQIAELLIDSGANMSVLFDNNESLLMRNSWREFDQTHLMAELLINKGADVRQKHRAPVDTVANMAIFTGWNNWQALHIASFIGNSEVVDVLLQHGADILALTSEGEKDLALKDYILRKDFHRHHRDKIDIYINNAEPWMQISEEENREYVGHVRGYDETVRLLRVAERQLAFAMGHHLRLGGQSTLTELSPDEVRMILNYL